jgi:hypothetical protein
MRSNASTCLPGMTVGPVAPPLRAVYTVALAAERERAQPAAGYRLYWMAEGRFGSCDVPPHGFVVVGRHALCDAVLDGDPTIGLRHVLVRARRLDDGCPRLSVLDLHTNLGFTLADGRPARSIAATGAIGFYVGPYALVALPGGEPAPRELPTPRVCEGLSHPYRAAQPIPSVTLLPRALVVGESSAPPVAAVTLSLSSAAGAASVRLSPDDLERGVLVGRAPKCAGALRAVLHEGISRAHLLVRRDAIYDLASTQGTYVYGRRVRGAWLHDAPPLQLGTASPVYLRVTTAAPR